MWEAILWRRLCAPTQKPWRSPKLLQTPERLSECFRLRLSNWDFQTKSASVDQASDRPNVGLENFGKTKIEPVGSLTDKPSKIASSFEIPRTRIHTGFSTHRVRKFKTDLFSHQQNIWKRERERTDCCGPINFRAFKDFLLNNNPSPATQEAGLKSNRWNSDISE